MSPVDQIKQKLDIVEFIGQYVQLKKAGRNFKANCPFHQEKSPSFVISPDRQIWHCFGSCGMGGDVVSFWMKWENLTFQEALKELAQVAGVELDSSHYNEQEVSQKDRILSINNLAARFYAHVLTKLPIGKNALQYLKGRGLNEKIIQTFEIGYGPSSWDSLIKFFEKKNIPASDLYEAGLVVKSDSSGRYYDRFRNRIVFPIKDAKDNIIGFSGRVLTPDQKSAKYVNTPETPIYHKRESLYGINLTRDAIRKEENVFIVEGEFDMITPYQYGVENIVAIKGAALTNEQLSILKRYTNRITLALDADEAGIEAMKRGIREAERMDFDIHIVKFTIGKDPDEAARTDLISFKKDLKKTLPIYDFLIDHLSQKYPGNSPFHKKKIGEEMAPYVAHIKNPIVQGHYVKKLAHILDVDEKNIQKIIYSQWNKEKVSAKSSGAIKKTSTMPRDEMMQKYLMSILLQQEENRSAIRKVFSIIDSQDFMTPSYQQLAERLKEYTRVDSNKYLYTEFVKTLPAEIQAVADELFLFATSDPNMSTISLAQLVYDFKRSCYQYFLAKYTKENDDAKVSDYNKRLHELNKSQIENTLQTV